YGEFGGLNSFTDPVEAVSSIISSGVAITSPILTFYFKRRILKALNCAQQRYTEKTAQSSKMFLKASVIEVRQSFAGLDKL
ncbi:hypothetical protein OSTOST_22078, partial [Ostertagia ostertagi]